MQKTSDKPAIFISYAWNSESEAIVNSIQEEFQKRGVRIIRDKTDLKYKGRIKEFMEQIGRGKYVILIISNKYLHSENCMFEIIQIFKNQNFYERIFPVVLDEVKIAKASDRLDLVKHWENETKILDDKIRNLDMLANIQGVTDDLNLYAEIRNNIARLTNILKDINTLNTNLHIRSNFEQLYQLIHDKIKADSGRMPITTNRTFKIILLIGLFLIGIFLYNWYGPSLNILKGNDIKSSVKSDVDTVDSIVIKTKDQPKLINETIYEKDGNLEKANLETMNVILVIPSKMVDAEVYVDNKPANIIERNLIFITVQIVKKNSSHHFQIKKGSENCSTNRFIQKDSIKVSICN